MGMEVEEKGFYLLSFVPLAVAEVPGRLFSGGREQPCMSGAVSSG